VEKKASQVEALVWQATTSVAVSNMIHDEWVTLVFMSAAARLECRTSAPLE
jgi:hypothetical protein